MIAESDTHFHFKILKIHTFPQVFSFTLFCILRLVEQIKVFVEDTDPESTLEVGADMRKIKLCFNHLKVHLMMLEGEGKLLIVTCDVAHVFCFGKYTWGRENQ